MSSPRESEPGPFRRLVRVELLGTVALVVLLLGAYAYFFVDDHLEWGLEYVGGRLIGAQVDVAELSTGWVRPSLTVEGLVVTDPEKPSTNWIELDTASLALNLDALLRARVVVERARLTGIRLGTERARPGWVQKQGDLRWLYEALGRLLSAELRAAASGTVLEDALALSSGEGGDRWERLREDLESPEVLQRASETLEGKRARIDEILNGLPERSTLDELEREVKQLRSAGQGGLAGRVDQLRRIRSLADRVDRLSERLGTASADLRSTLGELSTLKQQLESSTAEDLRSLRDRVSMPDLSLEGLSRRLFEGFIERRAGSLHTLLTQARPYLSASSTTSDPAAGETDETPGGADRTFGARSAYPGFWLKELDVSGTGKAGRGLALEASVRHLSSDPARVESPAEFEFSARPLDAGYEEVRGRATLEASEALRVGYELEVRGWTLREWALLDSPDAAVAVTGGTARFGLEGQYSPQHVSTRLGMMVPDPRMRVTSEDARLKSLLEGALGGLGRLELRASGEGAPESVRWSVESNLGRVLADGLRTVIRQGVDRARDELEQRFQREIGSRKQSLLETIDGLSSNARGTLQDRRDRLDELEQSLLDLGENRPALDLDFS